MRRHRLLVAAALAATVLGGTASAALAGEVTGQGKPVPGFEPGDQALETASVCRFSGKNDDPTGTLGEGPGGPSQSYGQEVRLGLIDPHFFNPSGACNPNAAFAE